jgi:hypothetical protein
MDAIIDTVANTKGIIKDVYSYGSYRKYLYTSFDYDVYVDRTLINDTKAEYSSSSINYRDLVAKNILGHKISAYSATRLCLHHNVIIDLSDTYCLIVEIKGSANNITGSIICFCIASKAYKKYYPCNNLQFAAVFLSASPTYPIIGVKKIFMRKLFCTSRDKLPDALIIYTELMPVHPVLYENILCYAFENFIIINTEHEQIGLLNYYFSLLGGEFGVLIKEVQAFQYYKTNIGYDLICNIDLEHEQLIKNACKI